MGIMDQVLIFVCRCCCRLEQVIVEHQLALTSCVPTPGFKNEPLTLDASPVRSKTVQSFVASGNNKVDVNTTLHLALPAGK